MMTICHSIRLAGCALALLVAGTPAARAQTAAVPQERVGNFAVVLRLPADGLYAGEESEIEFRVVDASKDDPVLGPPGVIRASIESTITMPAMPGMPSQIETAHAEGIPGEYGIHPVFAHGGEFLIRLKVAPPGAEPFTVAFPVTVKDADPKRASRPKPYTLELSSRPSRPTAGEPVSLELAVRDTKSGERVAAFDIAHEKLLHLMIIRDDPGTFSHEHPEIQPNGTFKTTYRFPSEGRFRLFADVAPKGRGSQVLVADLEVKAAKGVPRAPFKLDPSRSSVSESGGVKATLSMESDPVTGHNVPLTVRVTDAASGEPVTDLQPYLGAMGHMVLVSEDGNAYVHSHPDESNPNAGRDGAVTFNARFSKPGLYRCWAQFQRRGAVITTDFVVAVKGARP